jgi:hypothetical protein
MGKKFHKPSMYELDEREHASVLAGLRMLMQHRDGNKIGVEDVEEIATSDGELEALSAEEIDVLCHYLNTGGH